MSGDNEHVGSAADISGMARPVSTPPAGARPSCTEDDGMRRQAVAFFLGDAAFMADPKFRALARRLPSDDDFNSAVGAFFVALAAAGAGIGFDSSRSSAVRRLPSAMITARFTRFCNSRTLPGHEWAARALTAPGWA